MPLRYGLKFDRAAYAEQLLRHAETLGAEFSQEAGSAHLHVDCAPSQALPGWQDGRLQIASGADLPGLEWQVLANAARRLCGLSAGLGNCDEEAREYTRLALQEEARITDMRALLNNDKPAATANPALRRKIDLFTACGRIPTEDFEVFAPHEWLAALIARGLEPRRYDRMAETLPEGELMQWLTRLRDQIARITGKEVSA